MEKRLKTKIFEVTLYFKDSERKIEEKILNNASRRSIQANIRSGKESFSPNKGYLTKQKTVCQRIIKLLPKH